jgi:esterase/lipase superfamily enzyme
MHEILNMPGNASRSGHRTGKLAATVRMVQINRLVPLEPLTVKARMLLEIAAGARIAISHVITQVHPATRDIHPEKGRIVRRKNRNNRPCCDACETDIQSGRNAPACVGDAWLGEYGCAMEGMAACVWQSVSREPASRMWRIDMFWLFATWLLIFVLPGTGYSYDMTQDPADTSTGQVTRVEAPERVSVFYLTNREFRADKPVADSYSGERGEARFGRCEVEFTPIPIINNVASRIPFYIQSETRAVSFNELDDQPLFWEQLRAGADSTSTGSVVLFVHGYNYSFERTCSMAAEMQRYLRGKAAVFVFSWPSNGLPSDYVRDQADMEWSVPLLADIIEQLGEQFGRDNIRVMAHSLGSRGVIHALQRLGSLQDEQPVIDDLVLLAPDFDSQTFVDLMPWLGQLAAGITLYASVNDAPLKLSRQLNGYPRLGEAGAYLTVVEGVETVDVSSVGRYQVTGHEYFYFHPRVTADLVALLGTGVRAWGRTGLRERTRAGLPYWEFVSVDNEGEPDGNAGD